MALDPIVEAMLKQMAQAGGPTLSEMSPPDARAMYRMMSENYSRAAVHSVTDRDAAGVKVRIYRPSGQDNLPCLVYFHGGGWVIGDLETHDNVCRHIASSVGCVVVATDYRLAPEHPFPAPFDDCYTVAKWVAENAAELNVDVSRIAVGGDSAGGNLSACVALRARSEGPALVHQLLMCPVTDAAMDTASYSENAEGYMLTRASMEWFFSQYLGDKGDPLDPHISPMRAGDLTALPPATVLTAEFDPLRDEGEAYAARLASAGVDTHVQRFEGMVHNFMTMTDILPTARTAMEVATQRLKAAFDLD